MTTVERQPNAWLTIDRVATQLNVSYWTAYRLVKDARSPESASAVLVACFRSRWRPTSGASSRMRPDAPPRRHPAR
jgi:orotate phosphoribosyltransferase-like protein